MFLNPKDFLIHNLILWLTDSAPALEMFSPNGIEDVLLMPTNLIVEQSTDSGIIYPLNFYLESNWNLVSIWWGDNILKVVCRLKLL